MKKRLFQFFIIPTFLISIFFPVSAQTLTPSVSVTNTDTLNTTSTTDTPSPTPTASPQVNDVQSTEISGKVTKVDGNTITIQDSSNNFKELTIPSGVQVKRDNKDASVSDIKVDDNVKAKVDNNNQVLSVEVTSNSLSSATSMLIPVLVIALILIGLIIFFVNKSKKGQIMTSVEKIK